MKVYIFYIGETSILIYESNIVNAMRRLKEYRPDLEDVIQYHAETISKPGLWVIA